MKLGGEYLTEFGLKDAGFRSIGNKVRIHTRASIYCPDNISIGDNVRIDDFTIIIATGQVKIGNHVSIPNFCFLGGTNGIVLEDFVTLAPGVKLFTDSDDYSGEKLTGPTVPHQFTGGRSGRITLKRHVIIGAGSVVLPSVTIGEGSSVGALSLVTEDLEPWGVYAGIPVKRIRDRKKNLLALKKEFTQESKYHES